MQSIFLAITLLSACKRDDCDLQSGQDGGFYGEDGGWYGEEDWIDTGYVWVDTGGWYEPYRSLEIGIGTTTFIDTPVGSTVSPGTDIFGTRYFDVALRGYGIEPKDLTVTLAAYVGIQRYAAASHPSQNFRCHKWGDLTMGSLRLDLDPDALPRPTAVEIPVDTGWYWSESGDTGGWRAPQPRQSEADLQVVATVTEPDGDAIVAETWWYIPR